MLKIEKNVYNTLVKLISDGRTCDEPDKPSACHRTPKTNRNKNTTKNRQHEGEHNVF